MYDLLVGALIEKPRATKEAEGSSLFDHLAPTYRTNIRTIHYLDNRPTLLTGGAANLKPGHHLGLPKDTPPSNVWLTMPRGIGIPAERHGDSTGSSNNSRPDPSSPGAFARSF